MSRLMSIVLTVVITAATSAMAAEWDIEDFVLAGSRPAGIGEVRPAADGKYYYHLNDDNIIERVDYATGKSEVVFDTRVDAGCDTLSWDGYALSDNERVILLWTGRRPIYRHSFKADYYTFDRDTRRLTRVSEHGGEEIAVLSPTGGQVAYVWGNNVWLHSVDGGATVQVTHDGRANHIINGVPDWVYQEELGMLSSLRWSPDETQLAWLRWDESEVPEYSMTLYEGDCDSRPEFRLHPGRFDFKYAVAGERNSTVSLHTYNILSGERRDIDVAVGDGYIAYLGYHGSTTDLLVGVFNRNQCRLWVYDYHMAADTPVATTVRERVADSWIAPEELTGITPVGRTGEWVYRTDVNNCMQLMIVDRNGTHHTLTPPDEDVTDYYGCDSHGRYFYYQATAGPLQRVVCRVDRDGKVQLLSPAEGWSSAQFGNDCRYGILNHSDNNRPDRYTVVDHRGREMRVLEDNKAYAERYVGRVPSREFFEMENEGYLLNGFFIKPPEFDPTRRYPVIVTQYSGPCSQEVTRKWLIDWRTYCALQGYVVVCVDGRGTGGRGRAFSRQVYRRLGELETRDQLAVGRYMAAQPWVDADHIGIWGWSYGGFEVLMALTADDCPFAAGVAIAPVSSWRYYDTIYTERFMDTPQENPEGYAISSPLDRAHNIKAELLLMFGSADDNVHIINSMQLAAKLHGCGKLFDMMVYPNMNHSINGCGVRAPLYRKVLSFYDRVLR